MRLTYTQRLRLKAGFVAASLVPGAVLAAPASEPAPIPPTKRSAITQTVDVPPIQNFRLELSNLINGGRRTIDFPGGRTAHFKLSNLEQSALQPKERAIYAMLEELADKKTDKAWVALKQILESPLPIKTVKVDRAAVTKIAALGVEAKNGFELAKEIERSKELGPRPNGEAARADWYRRLVEKQGFEWRTGVNQMNVIGLRGFDVDRGKNPNAFNRWNDTLAFVWNDGKRWQVKELAATTDPGYKAYWESPDANGDGSGDVAHLLPGQYPYRMGTHRGVGGAGVPEINVPVARDTNHNGHIERREERASIKRGDVGYGINIHWGPGYEGGGVGPYSLGCQVTVLDSNQFHAQVTPLLAANKGQMLYTLVDMDRVA